ncbi:hypothetical protein [Kitasatospora cheerisanensis]|uniref:Uncharacterized protein n=1 Tax=Kitasatospora cheerisanensis KCTC 2395 TaxID=1348663 RepID=A0A066Z1N7_9ACTN|nr:hypothetical protein [Kitasatospora cheerisanensis]KDN87432.1 hypothetical protein KCH_08040 [Kitasatospora cheerisanensis KCTC 2395]
MEKSVETVLEDLVEASTVSVRSGEDLLGKVKAAIAADDKKRADRGEGGLRRKPHLAPLHRGEFTREQTVAMWDVLHTLASATALSAKGAGRGMAEHWGALKYHQALAVGGQLQLPGHGQYLRLTGEGRGIGDYYKHQQSTELGTGLALTIAKHVLGLRYPHHCVSILPVETVLRAGWAVTDTGREARKGGGAGHRYRPQYLAEVWRPGEASLVVPIVSKGNHSNSLTSAGQLASASAHAEGLHIGEWNETPGLLFSTELSRAGVVTVHVLRAVGRGGRLDLPDGELPVSLNEPSRPAVLVPGVRRPAEGGRVPEPEPGWHLGPDDFRWFQETLGRTEAAGLMAFTDSGNGTAQYLTVAQGRKRFEGYDHAAGVGPGDLRETIRGESYVGTDHVFRLNGTRVEAFSGVHTRLFDLLIGGDVAEYRAVVHANRRDRPWVGLDEKWGGPVSVHADGSVLALRVLTDGSRRPAVRAASPGSTGGGCGGGPGCERGR